MRPSKAAWGDPPSTRALAGITAAWPNGINRPFNIIVNDASSRRDTACAITHLWSLPIPNGSLIAQDGYLVSSPEFTFVQMGNIFSLPQLIALGMEFAGGYRLRPQTEEGFEKRQPLTTATKLRAFVDSTRGSHGRTKALRACAYLMEGSASPRETALALFLTLPYLLGGYGIARPQLNSRVRMPTRAVWKPDRNYRSCDLTWPEFNFSLEYDSNRWHTGSERISRDAKRQGELGLTGMEVIPVSNQQIMNATDMEKIALLAAKKTGKRIPKSALGPTQARVYLRREIFKIGHTDI